MKKYILLFTTLLCLSFSLANKPELPIEIPELKKHDKRTVHTGFTLVYNEEHEQASWVAYELTKEETEGTVKRSNKFKNDTTIKTGTATDVDYKKSGFDRGHLAPAADMKWSENAMRESFLYSNISPQVPNFNRGIWNKLEEQVREWAKKDGKLYIVTGPILDSNLKQIGINRVSVPNYFFKAILVLNKSPKGIGFIIPNEGSSEALKKFAVPIDWIEKKSGLNLYPQLQDKLEDTIESQLCIDCWTWMKE